LAGKIVREIEPHTESDVAALFTQLFVMFGNLVGRGAYWIVEDCDHYTNLFLVLLGDTSRGRKGSAYSRIKKLFCRIDPNWVNKNILTTLSTGEGIISRVKDSTIKREEVEIEGEPTGEYRDKIINIGVEDKRLLAVIQEYSSFLKLAARENNILSATVRSAWDGEVLDNPTKHDPIKATGSHISIIAHITRKEFLSQLTTTEICNGFVNRHICVCCKRSKLLPHGGATDPVSNDLVRELYEAVQWAKNIKEVGMDEETKKLWEKAYYEYDKPDLPELVEAATSRGEAQTRRIAMLYALLDKAPVVRKEHLLAALEVWRYCEDSIRYVFSGKRNNRVAEKIHEALKKSPDGLTRSEISALFGRNLTKETIDTALGELSKAKQVDCKKIETGGLPEERWFYTGK